MTFGAIGFLFAAAAAIIPVVLHMINRQRAKDLPFSTLRFLRISVEKTRRRRRIQDIFLMLLRMAVLVLIALGLAKPTLTSLKSLLGGGANTAVAIILDNSASMGTIDNDRIRFETALGAATQIMDELQDGDQVALYLTGGPDFPELGKLDRSHEKVRQILSQCAVSYERADLAVKVHDARKLLVKSEAPNKEIFVISDLQELSWEGLKKEEAAPGGDASEASLSDEEREIRDVPIILVDCHRAPKPNVAVVDVDLRTVVPVAGVPVQATVELVNAASVAQTAHLELYVDGKKSYDSPALSLTPEGRLKHDFQFTFERGGLHRGEVRLAGDDGSKLDDRRFFTMEVDQGIPVAVVTAERHEIAYLDDSFYVEQALAPARAGGWAIRTTSLASGELVGEPLANYTVIYCVNLPALEVDAAERLRTYVEHGGNLVWICGDNVQPAAYNRMNEDARRQLLPAPLREIRNAQTVEGRDSWNVTYLDKEHKALAHLVEPAAIYQSVLVYTHARIDAKAAGGARVLARLDDGEPLLVQRRVEQGTVTMLGTSAHRGWTNLPVRPIFLPLIARLTFDLAGVEQARHQALAGVPIVIPFHEEIRPRGVEVLSPSGATIRLSLEKDGEAGGPQEFRYADTHDVGIYVLRLLEAVRPTQYAYSVNLDPDETSPAKIARENLEERFGGTPLVFAEDPDDLSATFDWLREGTSLWEVFLSAVLIALVFETFISNQLSPKQDDDSLKHVAPGMRRLAKKGRGAA
ncbi:MAG TPA: BatA and WFA domain-containing protein [Thermoguttaceae bacterium]|nr:BatA and WFA domain-containing protein [Thermoguttaceae bacterium]